MNCPKCGSAIRPGARFCTRCGEGIHWSEQAQPYQNKKFCPHCKAEAQPDEVYCSRCGTLLLNRSVSGTELMRLRMMSLYDGEPTVGIAKATGTLILRDDRLEFHKVMGNAIGSAFGLVGVAAAAGAMKEQVEIYPLLDIAAVRDGRYAGVLPSLVLTMKGGKIISFSGGSLSGDTIRRLVQLIDQYRF